MICHFYVEMKHITKQLIFIILCWLILILSDLFAQKNAQSKDRLPGFWLGTIEAENHIDWHVYHLYKDDSGRFTGKVHYFRNYKKLAEFPMDSIRYDRPNIFLFYHTEINIIYKGFVIFDNQTIGGKLFYPDCTSVPWTLKKLDIDSEEGIVPRLKTEELLLKKDKN